MKNIYLIVGRSGSGKTTLVNWLCDADENLSSVNSYTTRPKRTPYEKGHIFVSDKQFDELNNIVAYTEFNGYRYAATQEQVDKSAFYVIDPAGVEYFKNHYTGTKGVKVIYIQTSYRQLFVRLVKRDGLCGAVKRMWHDHKAFKSAKDIANMVVTNDHIPSAAGAIWRYIQICER